MPKYRVETEDGKAYEIETEDAPALTMENAGKFLGAAWEKINPIEGAKALYGAVTDPVTTARGIWEGHANLAGEATDAFKRGDYATAAQKGIGATIPLLGPDLEHSVAQLREGNTAEGLGGLAGTIGGMFLPNPAGKLRLRVGIPGMDALAPAERAAVDFMVRRGVPLPGGTQGGGLFARALQKAAAVSPLGAYLAPKMERATEANVLRLADELGTETHPTRYTPQTAGESTMGALSKKAEGLEKQAGIEYGVVAQAEADPRNTRSVQQGVDQKGDPIMEDVPLPIDTAPFRAEAKALYDHMNLLSSSALRSSSAAYSALKGLMDGPRYIRASVAEEILGTIKELARTGTGRNAGRAKFLVAKFQPVIDDALDAADPDLLTSIREGRHLTAQQKATERVHQRLTGVSKEPTESVRIPEPVSAFRRVTQEGDTRIRLLKQIERETPEQLPVLGRAYAEDILQSLRNDGFKQAKRMFNEWNALGPETKAKLYPNPMVRQNWDHFFRGIKEIADNPNPSGTAVMTLLGGQAGLTGGVSLKTLYASAIGSGIAALMYTPRGAALIRKGFKLPANTAPGIAWANEVGNLIEQMTDEDRIKKQLGGKPMLPYEYANPALDPRRRPVSESPR